MAIHTEGVAFCLEHGLGSLASGFVRYENTYPEQWPEIVPLFKEFVAEYNISYLTPIYNAANADEVKYTLLELGISTKSLEGVSLFGDSPSAPTPAVVADYIRAKLPLCRSHLALRLPHHNLCAGGAP